MVLTVWKASSAQRTEGGGASLRGAAPASHPRLSWEEAGAGVVLCRGHDGRGPVEARKESVQEQVRKGNQVREGTLPGRVGGSAAPRSTPLHMARLAEETVIQRVATLVCGLHRQEDPAVLQRQGACGWTAGRGTAAGSPPEAGAHLVFADEMN